MWWIPRLAIEAMSSIDLSLTAQNCSLQSSFNFAPTSALRKHAPAKRSVACRTTRESKGGGAERFKGKGKGDVCRPLKQRSLLVVRQVPGSNGLEAHRLDAAKLNH